jgi:hypothetical protein
VSSRSRSHKIDALAAELGEDRILPLVLDVRERGAV